MHEGLLRALLLARPAFREHWERLLRAAPARSPLANPDVLVFLMDWTLDRFFHALSQPYTQHRPRASTGLLVCPCGRNPLLDYFACAEQAFVYVWEHLSYDGPAINPIVRAANGICARLVLRDLAEREVANLCGVCRHRTELPCRAPASRVTELMG